MALNVCKGAKRSGAATRTLLWSEIDSSDVALSLMRYPAKTEIGSKISATTSPGPAIDFSNESARRRAHEQTMKRECMEDKQDDERASAMTEELNFSVTVSENGIVQPRHYAVPFKDWTSARSVEKNARLERMGSGLSTVTGSGGDSADRYEDLRKHSLSMEQSRRLPSSQYKGVIPQPNGSGFGSGEAAGSGFGRVCEKGKEHLFDKAVTPSDVGKLNRLVIPKQYAEKYFPLDANSSKKGLLLNFEDNTGKVWRFRYSYWNSSQSYVLTKGWSRFGKDKKLEAGDIVSFHRGSTQPQQLYISWRRRPSGQPRFGIHPQLHQSKARVMNGSPSVNLNPLNSGTQAAVVYNAQWMPVFWPSSKNPDAFLQFNSNSIYPLVCNKVGHVDAAVTTLNGALPFYCSEPPIEETEKNREGLPSMDLYLNYVHKSLNSGDRSTHNKPLHPGTSAAQQLETAEHKLAASCIEPTTKKSIKLFGVTLVESHRFSPQPH